MREVYNDQPRFNYSNKTLHALKKISHLTVRDVPRNVLHLARVRGLELGHGLLGPRGQHDAVGGGEEAGCDCEADAAACAGDDYDLGHGGLWLCGCGLDWEVLWFE